ncbi:hypothetical protein Plhal710r2_c006g0027711 [Plasmopara halstedii]
MSIASVILCKWLDVPERRSAALATFIRMVTSLLGSHCRYVQTYFDDIFRHYRA